jgi:ABC-2 type transport system permease protein
VTTTARQARVPRLVSGPLLRHTWRAQRLRVGLIALALGVWGFLMPVIYATFGRQLEVLLDTGIIPDAFLRLLGADPFSLDGAVALGAVHPIALALQVVYPVGFAAAAIAGERQRGTLEVLLARPLSRRTVFATLLLALLGFGCLTTAAQLGGTVLGAVAYGVAGQLDAAQLAFLGLDTALLLAALAALSLAASASFDRLGPPIAFGVTVVLLGYVLEVLGTLWPDAAFLQPLSPFHYLRPLEVLAGRGEPSDLVVLAVVAALGTAFGLWRFPRRDLAAPT